MKNVVLIASMVMVSSVIAQEPPQPQVTPVTAQISVALPMDVELLAGAQRALNELRGKSPVDVDKAMSTWSALGMAAKTEELARQAITQEMQRQRERDNPEVNVWMTYIEYRVALEKLGEFRKQQEQKKKAEEEAKAKASSTPTPTPSPTATVEAVETPKEKKSEEAQKVTTPPVK